MKNHGLEWESIGLRLITNILKMMNFNKMKGIAIVLLMAFAGCNEETGVEPLCMGGPEGRLIENAVNISIDKHLPDEVIAKLTTIELTYQDQVISLDLQGDRNVYTEWQVIPSTEIEKVLVVYDNISYEFTDLSVPAVEAIILTVLSAENVNGPWAWDVRFSEHSTECNDVIKYEG